MKSLRRIVLASFMAMGVTSMVAPAFAGDKKEEMKCDKDGKACKDGKDCNASNCKAEKK